MCGKLLRDKFTLFNQIDGLQVPHFGYNYYATFFSNIYPNATLFFAARTFCFMRLDEHYMCKRDRFGDSKANLTLFDDFFGARAPILLVDVDDVNVQYMLYMYVSRFFKR